MTEELDDGQAAGCPAPRKRFQARLKEVRDAILEDRRAHGGRAPDAGSGGPGG